MYFTYDDFKIKYERDEHFKKFVDGDFKRYGWESVFVDHLTNYVREKRKKIKDARRRKKLNAKNNMIEDQLDIYSGDIVSDGDTGIDIEYEKNNDGLFRG